MTCFGTSAAYIAACMKDGVEPGAAAATSRALRAVGSTGSPLSPEGFDWVYEHVGADTWLFSTSGGTDVCTAFVGGVPIAAGLPRRAPGARARRARSRPATRTATRSIDEVGELVITEPMPSMPVFFWGDEDGSRYRESYFEMYPGVWRHGDWIEITSRGTAIIYGRSDSTINRGGVRMGTSEIYRAVLARRRGRRRARRRRPAAGHRGLDAALRRPARRAPSSTTSSPARSRARIREQCSPRHVPERDLRRSPRCPRTLSGKVLEVPVKRILMGDAAPSRRRAATRSPTRRRSALRGARRIVRMEELMTYIADDGRYERMPYRRTGRSGLLLPAISLGLWNNFGADRPLETQPRDRAGARSTSASPTSTSPTTTARPTARPRRPSVGCSRRTSRRTATSSSSRPRPATTCGPARTASGARASTCSRASTRASRRMGLDYVDIFYSHRFDPDTPLEETMGALDTRGAPGQGALRRHLVLLAGADARGGGDPARDWARRCSSTSRPTRCSTAGSRTGCSTRSASSGSAASGSRRSRRGCSPTATWTASRRARGSTAALYLTRRSADRPDRGEGRARSARSPPDAGQTLPAMALAWTLRDPRMTSTLVGASSVEQLEANVAGARPARLLRRRARRRSTATRRRATSTSGRARATPRPVAVSVRHSVGQPSGRPRSASRRRFGSANVPARAARVSGRIGS